MSNIYSSIFTRIRHAGKSPRRVWLTLDDGPDPINTEKILKVLDRHRIKAAFFMIGEKVAAQPAVVQRVFDAGHRIGNHTFSHRRLTELTAAEIRDEIETTAKLISAFTRDEKIFRPPFGAIDQTVCAIADDLGHRTVLWNVDPTDWDLQCQPKGWIDKALHATHKREASVILAHDDRRTTAENFDLFIRRLKKSGRIAFENPATLCAIAGQLNPD
ncbi:polysaccharide deacetylase family protein [Mesorhizobium loti]|uniref:polysaccharide deacetylase family protein n=1 Tax=Rhizobium loti TaxID=381 RepID=UPI0006864163|nr:polysaccharide deacetylase family protein [Mesorhizobium loti]